MAESLCFLKEINILNFAINARIVLNAASRIL